MDMTDLAELAERAVAEVVKLGASDCDVIATESSYFSAEIEKGSMKQASMGTDPGVGIRAFKNGCQGFAFCTGADPNAVRRAAALAVSQAGAGTPDPDFKGLPPKGRPPQRSGLFERSIAELESDDVVEMAIELANRAGDDKRITSVNAGVGVGFGTSALANSNGFSDSQRMSAFEVSVEAVARHGKEMFSGVDGGWSRRLDKAVLRTAPATAKEFAIRGLSHTKIETGDYQVVLDPLALGFILGSAVGGGANAESVQRGRSFLGGLLGKRIGSEKLTLVDDPTIEWAVGSYRFDGEGTPGARRKIIDRGVLSSYLHDSYTAGKEGVASTGNSSRGGSIWSFRRPPSIAPSNLVVARGDASLDEMIDETKRGVFLRLTYDYPNIATGEFSGLMMESFKIEKGSLGPSIRQSTIGTGILDMFANVDLVGKKSRDAFGVKTPPMRISKARIGGSS